MLFRSASIQVPLWVINLRDFSLPLNLTYNTSGLKVNDLHSIAGMGWSLNAGGFIKRQVRGFPDEYQGENGTEYKGWFDIDQSSWFCELDSIKRYYEGEWDFQPDIFYYNISNEMGSFIFGSDESIHLTKLTDIRIDVDFENYDPAFCDVYFSAPESMGGYFGSLNFFFTDNQGTKSYVRPIEYSYTKTSQYSPFDLLDSLSHLPRDPDSYYQHFISDCGSITGWALDRVETAVGEVINYHYSNKVGLTEFEFPVAGVLTNNHFKLCDSAFVYDNFSQKWVIDTVTYQVHKPEYWVTNSFEGKYVVLPDSITSENETIVFSYGSYSNSTTNHLIYSHQIDEVSVIDRFSRDTVSIIRFIYGYYPGNGSLRLDSLKSFGNSTSNAPSMLRFDYIEGDLPFPGSFRQDLYGYQNSNSVEHMLPLVPLISGYQDLGYLDGFDYTAADRNINDSLCMVGCLSGITYSAGAKVDLFYEVNGEQVSGTYPTRKIAPGLRVLSMELRDQDGSLIKKSNYQYSGLSGHYFYENSFKYLFSEASSSLAQMNGVTPYYNFVRYSSVPYLKNMGGPPYAGFYYTTVNEEILSENLSDYYTIIQEFNGVRQITSFEPRLDKRILLGTSKTDIIKTELYCYEVSDYEILTKQRLYSYVFEGSYYECHSEIPIVSNPCCPTTSLFKLYSMTMEPLFFSPYRLNRQVDVSYNKILGSNIPVLSRVDKVVDYSDNINLPARISTIQYLTDSETPFSIDESNFRYSGDYGATTSNQMIHTLKGNSINGAIIDSWTTQNSFLTEAWSNEYNSSGQLVRKKRFFLDFELLNTDPWDEEEGLVLTAANISKEVEIEYIDKKPTLRITPKGTELTIWGYNNSLPVAIGTGVSPHQVFYTSFEEDIVAVHNPLSSKTGTSYMVIDQAYEVNQSFPPGQYTMTYFHRNNESEEWIYMVEVKNLSVDGFVSTSISSGQIDELRVFPTGKPFMTYTHKPFFGVTSESDINGRTTYFQYDGFGRQILVRDQYGNILRKIHYQIGRAHV